jgi:hypothetical protein
LNPKCIDKNWLPNNLTDLIKYKKDCNLIQAAFEELKGEYAKACCGPADEMNKPTKYSSPSVPAPVSTPGVSLRDNVKRLEDLGFTRTESIKALVQTTNNFMEAVNKLLES